MKTASFGDNNALIALINGGNFFRCDCYTLNLAGGGVVRFTTADADVIYNGNRFSSNGVRVDSKQSRVLAHWKIGLDVDTWIVVVNPRTVDPVTGADFPDMIGDVPWIEAAGAGALDAANVVVERAYFNSAWTWPLPAIGAVTPVGCLIMFAGVMGEVDTTDSVVCLTLNDYRVLLSQMMPKNLFSAACRHTLFDIGCTLNPATFAAPGELVEGSTQANLLYADNTLTATGSGSFTLGRVVMTSGLNAGFRRTIRIWNGINNFSLLNPLPFAVSPGDTFTCYPGCDKTSATCTNFGNLINFGGQRFIPAPETAT